MKNQFYKDSRDSKEKKSAPSKSSNFRAERKTSNPKYSSKSEFERTRFERREQTQEPDFERTKFEKPEKNAKRDSHASWRNNVRQKKTVSIRKELFDEKSIPEDAAKIIANFDKVIEDVMHLSGKQKVTLPAAVKNLSHQLTDERGTRRLGYMNEASFLSAYVNYFMWWNLVRLCRLFANLPKSAFNFDDETVALDIGSGPLTIPIALWLSRPELRSKKIVWYCLDLSSQALSLGEEIYLSVAAKTIAAAASAATAASSESKNEKTSEKKAEKTFEPWKIIRVKGSLGTAIKEKADFVTCGNTFNEIIQRNEMPTDFLAKKYSSQLISYLKDEKDNAEKKQNILLIEPGDPHSARFISLIRNAFIRQNFKPVAPCPHIEECPMAGRTGGRATNASGKNTKWCNFAFSTDSAPKTLLRLSEKAGIPKERASLSFIFVSRDANQKKDAEQTAQNPENEKIFIRIASDFIKLPEIRRSGYYACSKYGMLLAVDENHIQPKNGELLQIRTPENLDERDQKSGAIIVKI